MALVSVGWELEVSMIDAGANTTKKTYDLRATTATDAATAAAALLPIIDSVSDAAIQGYRLAEVFAEDALVLPAEALITELASLVIQIAGNPLKKATITIPSPNIGIFVAATGVGRDIVDTGDTALLNYVDQFKAAGRVYISDGEDAEALVRGERVTRARRLA